jgi:hypothetical protein
MRRLVLFACLTILVGPAAATDVTVFGAGTQSCGKFLASAEHSADRVGYWGWAAGFLTATNDIKNQQVSIDMDGAMAWVENYCRAHPLDPYFVALDALSHVLDRYVIKVHTP